MPYRWNMQVNNARAEHVRVARGVTNSAEVRFIFRHPDDWRRTVSYGWSDARNGYWIELVNDGERVVYDAFSDSYDHDRPLLGALRFMVEYSLLAPEDVADAISYLDETPDRCHRRPPRRLNRVIEVIRNFETAHG
jgi:hypothetical protein